MGGWKGPIPLLQRALSSRMARSACLSMALVLKTWRREWVGGWVVGRERKLLNTWVEGVDGWVGGWEGKEAFEHLGGGSGVGGGSGWVGGWVRTWEMMGLIRERTGKGRVKTGLPPSGTW